MNGAESMHIAAASGNPQPRFPVISTPRPAAQPSRADLLNMPGRMIHVSRDAEIYAEGSSPDHVYQVISGAVRTCKLMADGRRQVGEFALPGDLFGLDGIGAHFYTAEAIADTQLVCYSRRMLDEFAGRDQSTARRVQLLTLKSLTLAQKRIVLLGRKTALERVASFLLEMQDRSSDAGGCLTLRMSRYDIADHLGLTVETVSRSLGTLKERRAIALLDAHRIRIADRYALERLSGEDEVATH
jgi:CRP-like cAMP-binding protein